MYKSASLVANRSENWFRLFSSLLGAGPGLLGPRRGGRCSATLQSMQPEERRPSCSRKTPERPQRKSVGVSQRGAAERGETAPTQSAGERTRNDSPETTRGPPGIVILFLKYRWLLLCAVCNEFHSMQMSSQALVNCLELLEDDNTDTKICGCKALACIKVRSHRELLHTSITAIYKHMTLPHVITTLDVYVRSIHSSSHFCPSRLKKALTSWCTFVRRTRRKSATLPSRHCSSSVITCARTCRNETLIFGRARSPVLVASSHYSDGSILRIQYPIKMIGLLLFNN